jgi:hypothetical protein
MSQAAVEQILGKMVVDREFRKLMRTDQEKALAGFDLTAAERAGLKDVDLADFEQAVTGLDQHVSRGQAWN